MVAFFYFRRRRRQQAGHELPGSPVDHHERRNGGGNGFGFGRRGPEKLGRPESSSAVSGRSSHTARSDEPILEAVYDGFPGSTGYEDVRSLHSGEGAHSPNSSHTVGVYSWDNKDRGQWSRDRDELEAARANSAPLVVSYGPNPVTPTLRPRTGTLAPVSIPRTDYSRSDAISTDSRENIPPMPTLRPVASQPNFATYNNYQLPTPPTPLPPPPLPPPPLLIPSPQVKPPVPIIVSYGPNKVTPTPAVTSPTVPPDESMLKRMYDYTRPATSQDHRRFSFDGDDDIEAGLGLAGIDTSGGGNMAPLPPYASSADFVAMEKGAIRKLAEPQAQAELPPTKDGFYHFAADVTEYELPSQSHSHGGSITPLQSRPPALRDIDEMKFLLSDVEMAKLREQKAKIRKQQEHQRMLGMEPEAYELSVSRLSLSQPARRSRDVLPGGMI